MPPDRIPSERLQPCLLDRLTDDEPEKLEESRTQRLVSHQRYRRGVLRDLEWLFNTSAGLHFLASVEAIELKEYPHACRSVLNYGTRQLCGITAPDMARLQEELCAAVEAFEPRLTPRSLHIRANLDRSIVSFELEAELWAAPLPEHLHIKTTVDLETGQSLLGDAHHG